eukprot:6443372-Alexandrium_andersonii.AAC.1
MQPGVWAVHELQLPGGREREDAAPHFVDRGQTRRMPPSALDVNSQVPPRLEPPLPLCGGKARRARGAANQACRPGKGPGGGGRTGAVSRPSSSGRQRLPERSV